MQVNYGAAVGKVRVGYGRGEMYLATMKIYFDADFKSD
jgi:hypothetical protein